MPRSATLRSLALIGLVTLTATARADELPPGDAPAYTAVYHAVGRARDKAADPWKYKTDDTITISVLAKQSRWEHKDGTTRLVDSVSRYTTTWGGSTPPNVARRSQSTFSPIGWEFGYKNVAHATKLPPKVLGTETIAGQQCTRLQFDSVQFGKPEFCVTKTGIPLRFANIGDDAEMTYEATSVSEKAPAPDRFVTPKDYKVEEKQLRRL